MREPIPISVRIRAFFARDKDAFWWNHLTDEEKQLRRMDVSQLAKVINELRVRNLAGTAEKLIVAEHMLRERIAHIQSRPTWFAIWAGLVGIAGGAFLTSALQKPETQTKCVCECKHGGAVNHSEASPISKTVPPVVQVGKPKVNGVQNESQPSEKSNP